MTLWTLFFWRALGNGAACVGFMIRPSGVPDLLATLRRPRSVGLILLTEGALVFVALFFLLWAIYTGPVSLVSTVAATRPLFVFALGVILSIGATNVLNEPLEGKVLAVKLIATAMTVGGVITRNRLPNPERRLTPSRLASPPPGSSVQPHQPPQTGDAEVLIVRHTLSSGNYPPPLGCLGDLRRRLALDFGFGLFALQELPEV